MCQGFPLVSVGDFFFLTYSQTQLLWWQKSVGVPITCGFIQWGAECALLPLSPIKLFTDDGTQHFSEASHDGQDWVPQDSCLWALTMQSWAEIFFLLHFNCLFTKQIPAAQEHLWPNGESRSGWLFGSQRVRASSVAEGRKYGLCTQGRARSTGEAGVTYRCLQSALPKSLAVPPSFQAQEGKHCISILCREQTLRGTICLRWCVLSFQGFSFVGLSHSL